MVVRSRTMARLPGSWRVRSIRAPPRSATDRQTVPTGLASLPPPGPAIPVIPIPRSAPRRSIAPSASATATSGETAPWRSIRPASTPASATLASFEYTVSPPST